MSKKADDSLILVDDSAIHAHLRNYHCEDPDNINERQLEQLRKLLGEGHDPNALNHEGRTPLGMLCDQGWRDHPHWPAAAKLLLDAGANPLQKDKALNLAIQHKGMVNAAHSTLEPILAWLLIHEEDKKTRCEKGGNAFHVLSEQAYDLYNLLMTFPEDRLEMVVGESLTHLQILQIAGQWVGEKREKDGATILHTLWNSQVGETTSHPRTLWRTSAMLIENFEIDLVARDNKGKIAAETVYDGMVHSDFMESISPQSWEKIQAALEYVSLSTQTPATPNKNSRGARL